MGDIKKIEAIIQSSIDTHLSLLGESELLKSIERIVAEICKCFKSGGKVLFCGNGGSAADAQHIAAELSGRFYIDRDPLFAEALHVNTSYLTAVANDYGYEQVYSRLIKAKGKSGDILFGISTSGNSPSIIKALRQAQNQGVTTIGMTGESGGLMKEECDFIIAIPSSDTPRIQECHILIGHIVCQLIEQALFDE